MAVEAADHVAERRRHVHEGILNGLLQLDEQVHGALVEASQDIPDDDSDIPGRSLVLQERHIFGALVHQGRQQERGDSNDAPRRISTCLEWSGLRPASRGGGSSDRLEQAYYSKY